MKLIFFIVAIVALIHILNYFYIKTNYYKNMFEFENRIQKREEVPFDLQIINIGSGYARFSFDYKRTPLRGHNFAKSPQCLEVDFQILKQYANNLSEGCYVLINLPLFIFCFYRYESVRYEIKDYFSLDSEHIRKYSPLKNFFYKRYPIIFAGKGIIHLLVDEKKKGYMDYDCCMIPSEDIPAYAQEHYEVWKKQFSLIDTNKAEALSHLSNEMTYNVNLLKEMVDFCFNHKWHPIFITTPLCKELNSKFSKEFVDFALYKNIELANVRGVKYLDYRMLKEFQEDNNLFWNGVDWLSQSGRDVLMKKLCEDLELH